MTPLWLGRVRVADYHDLWHGQAHREAFLASREPDLQRLRKRYFPERQVLFPVVMGTANAKPFPPPPDALMTRSMACLP
ncbi:hypothetical protein GCM10017767_10750 [Halomonas urumqiensis]|nr:hypothetical protein GCM10017767_10750 [Halomonas urumqiensis]